MPLNLIKKYPELLEIAFMSANGRKRSLMGIFERDVVNNDRFWFRSKQIRPTKIEGEAPMDTLFGHLTTTENLDERGNKTGGRTFEMERSRRLHWLKHHIDEKSPEHIDIFSYSDRIRGREVIRTYIYDRVNRYVIVLEPQRSGLDYYLLTAYFLNKKYGKKQIEKKRKNCLSELY